MVRDRRRIDPETGQRRTPAPAESEPKIAESISGTLDDEIAEAEAEAAVGEAPSSGLQQQVDELTADLKRVTAEYANYRKRVERDREAVIEAAKASVAGDLLTVLDDVERAESHGDLNGAFKAVADKLIGSLNGAGLAPFGQEGDEFDPSVHEAVQHSTSPEVSGPTVTAVLRRGYRFGDRVLRPAMVAVTDHEPGEQPAESAAGEQAQAGEKSADQG
ncbi:heat shock protein (HSP-70 cofactor) [Saccharopolyspora erythraea NRRL 2338]|uniref:Protein GrpE n=1 Tax=Saccharopolyspora erythraea (strain ATCC 11635 / DSM 40517 / JCM 4748 / NBRC 13426 / NCIMB 8594 / NRRL 2338) TaxID=405948 RepID=A4FQP2_SACEN|nr:heat shock protein (HSP-70 cofactor) [Saccharopolyspora erythraea NRRL 2338]